MAKLRIYEVCVGINGIGYSTNCGYSFEKARELYKQRKQYENDVYLKSYNERWGDDKIIYEYHRKK